MADAVMRMDHFKVTIQCHSSHECDTGRAVDSQHEEVDAAPGLSKHPEIPLQAGGNTERHADDKKDVSYDQVKEEQSVGFPEFDAETENPQGKHVSWQAHNHLYNHENWLEQSFRCVSGLARRFIRCLRHF